MIFTGLAVPGVAWMVLIAAEMLAQNQGFGKFVWDEFQSGNLFPARIMVAVIWTRGLIRWLRPWTGACWPCSSGCPWDKRQVLR